jgi:hypothetical protein
MAQRKRTKPLMTAEEREEYERSLAEGTRRLEAQIAYHRRRAAEERERLERWEQSFIGRLSRRFGLAR